MRKVVYGIAIASLGFAVVLTLPHTGWSHPSFQHFPYVSDGLPACAVCHSSVNESYQPELLTEESKALVPTITKHYKAIEEPDNRYRTMEPDQRKQLLEQTKKIDQNSSVKLEASAATVAPGGTITVTVTTKGGIGPVVGIMLVDEPLRYQARLVQSTGWSIAAPPEIVGSDGKPQSKWLDRRVNKQQTNLNFALVYDAISDPAKDMYATSRVSYMLKAPPTPGEYPITAAFLYGTADPDEWKTGKFVSPAGGITGPSGRIQFSNTLKVRVQ